MVKRVARLLCALLFITTLLGCAVPHPPTITAQPTVTAQPSVQPTLRILLVTLADNGKTIELCKNEQIVLQLGEGYDWAIAIPDQTIISQVMNAAVVRGEQGIYTAHRLGKTTVDAVGDPICRQSDPPCEAPSLNLKIVISVVLSPNMFGTIN